MTPEQKERITEAMVAFVLRACSDKATSNEQALLPMVAELLLKFLS